MNDYIDRQAAIKAIEDLPNCYNGFSDTYDKACIIGVIDEQPTIEPVKHGRWIVVSDGYGNGDTTVHICECSECKDTIWVYKKATRRWNYCPNCGAKMDLEGEAHDQN